MTGMDGLRRAALTLHGLLPADREWVLSELDAADRVALTALLAELTELGIPADRDLVRDALAGRQPPTGGQRSAMTRLREATGGQVHALLVREPDALIAQLLLIDDWSWKPELLAMLGEGRQAAVVALMRRTEVKPALRRVLVDRLGERIPSERPLAETGLAAPGVAAQRKPSVGSWISARLRPWRR